MTRCLVTLCLLLLGCLGPAGPSRSLSLRRVVLYQNGIGYFERTGRVSGDRLRLRLRGHEIGDVLKTLIVVEPGASRQRSVAALLPAQAEGSKRLGTSLDVLLPDGSSRDLLVAYAVPTPVWKAAYRVVLPPRGTQDGLLQAWALIDNVSDEDWTRVGLTLATGAPLSFALDLRTPQFVSRPDLTGQLVRSPATGAVFAEQGGAHDADGDGIPDSQDLCASEPEDRDGFQDDDGCPDPDNDGDRILDRDDKCPNEPETYNGLDDADGCPDKGRVIVHSAKLEILDKIYFSKNSAALREVSRPILDAVTATLKGNPQLRGIEVGGHASEEESDPFGLAARRARAVADHLSAKGVQTALAQRTYGDTRPVSRERDETARGRNRRVEFIIQRQDDGEGETARPPPAVRPPPAAPPAPPRGATPRDVAGMVRYELLDPVTVPRGSSTLVSLINQRGAAEEVYLFRPDPGVPGSEAHPFYAARLRLDLALEPGPVAVFARGTFVGEGLLQRLPAGQTAFVPYALDSSTRVRVQLGQGRQPIRLVALRRGVATVEDAHIHSTRYEIEVGKDPPARMFLRHLRRPGYVPQRLLPQTESSAEAHLIPVPLTAGKPSLVTIEERRSEPRELRLAEEGGEALADYLGGTALAAEPARRLREALALLREQATLRAEIAQLRERQQDSHQRQEELRESLRSIERVDSAAALRRELTGRLQQAVAEGEQAAQRLVSRTEAQAAGRARLSEGLRDLVIEAQPR